MTSKNFTKGDRVKTREPSSLVGVVTRTHRVFHVEPRLELDRLVEQGDREDLGLLIGMGWVV